jgi:hypothetical protein
MRAGASRRPVTLLAILAAMTFASACYSSNYRRETLASVSLVSQLSDKLADYCRADFKVDSHVLSSEEMGEFYYGLEKARSFEQMTARRGGSRPSAEAFAKLADAYEKFVRDADQYRLNPAHTHQQLEHLMRDHDDVKHRAEDVRLALDRES